MRGDALRRWLTAAVVGLVAVIALGCTGTAGTSSSTSTEATTAPTSAPTTTPTVVPTGECVVAPEATVAMVASRLRDEAGSLREAFVMTGDGHQLLLANIYDTSNTFLANAEVWVIDGDQAWALSGRALDFTDLPDASEQWPGLRSRVTAEETALGNCAVLAKAESRRQR